MNEKRIQDLEQFLQENKLLKGKWCATVDEITERFQKEFDQLQKESGVDRRKEELGSD